MPWVAGVFAWAAVAVLVSAATVLGPCSANRGQGGSCEETWCSLPGCEGELVLFELLPCFGFTTVIVLQQEEDDGGGLIGSRRQAGVCPRLRPTVSSDAPPPSVTFQARELSVKFVCSRCRRFREQASQPQFVPVCWPCTVLPPAP